jgi:hypothetical protein
MRLTPTYIDRLEKNEVFVFGSNLAGIHGAGAALTAKKKFGATWGRCHGLDNNSYGIPTKDENLKTLPIDRIKKYIENFITDAENNPDLKFYVTPIGTGLAGYKAKDIAPLFREALNINNIYLPEDFLICLNLEAQGDLVRLQCKTS